MYYTLSHFHLASFTHLDIWGKFYVFQTVSNIGTRDDFYIATHDVQTADLYYLCLEEANAYL